MHAPPEHQLYFKLKKKYINLVAHVLNIFVTNLSDKNVIITNQGSPFILIKNE